MAMNISSRLCLLVIFIFPSPLFAKDFQTFPKEVLSAKLALDCSSEENISSTKDFGASYICIFGKAETARWYVIEKAQTGRVQCVGMRWVDWQTDTPYGIRADWEEVEKALEFLINWYAPTRRNDLLKAFWDSKSEDFITSDFIIYYTFKAGPQKHERLVVIEDK